jgi:two-component system, response regulator RegA
MQTDTAAPRPRASGTALILDEESSARRRLSRELEQYGYEVHATEDTAAVAALALSLQPALVVLELRLRSGSGLPLLSSLRPRLPVTRFVVLTSFGSVATAVSAMRLGAAGYLCKPVSVEHLLAAATDPRPDAEQHTGPESPADDDREALRPLTLDQAIWEYIHLTIEDAGSISEAARRLGLWRQSLKRMITKYRPEAAQASLVAAPTLRGRRLAMNERRRGGIDGPSGDRRS